MSNPYATALAEMGAVFSRLDDSEVNHAVEMIVEANTTVVFAGGRERLQIMGFAMRLFHMGVPVAVEGDMTTPPVGKGDLFIVTCGPGEISTALALMNVAKAAGATILFITPRNPRVAVPHWPITRSRCPRRPWPTIRGTRGLRCCRWARSSKGRCSCSSR